MYTATAAWSSTPVLLSVSDTMCCAVLRCATLLRRAYMYGTQAGQAKVRLFNLAPTAKYVDLKGSGNASGALASNVQYALGSGWVPVAPSAATFSALVDSKVVASKQTAPPPGGVFTTTLLGDAKQGYQLISLSDAPEGGVCKP
jgi:hypothetical protein